MASFMFFTSSSKVSSWCDSLVGLVQRLRIRSPFLRELLRQTRTLHGSSLFKLVVVDIKLLMFLTSYGYLCVLLCY